MTSPVSRVISPHVISPDVMTLRRVSDVECQVQLRIPEALRYFPNHFVQTPIVPGVVQLQWVVELARRYLQLDCRCDTLEQLKFQRIMCPADELTLTLFHDKNQQKLMFHFSNDDGQYSSGRIVLPAFSAPT